jgi:hypothetical protein
MRRLGIAFASAALMVIALHGQGYAASPHFKEGWGARVHVLWYHQYFGRVYGHTRRAR